MLLLLLLVLDMIVVVMVYRLLLFFVFDLVGFFFDRRFKAFLSDFVCPEVFMPFRVRCF